MYSDINTKCSSPSQMASAGQDQPWDVSQASVLLNQLRESQNVTHDAIGMLEGRLSNVLLAVPTQQDSGVSPADASISPICDELQSRVYVEHSARIRILALLDRLTV